MKSLDTKITLWLGLVVSLCVFCGTSVFAATALGPISFSDNTTDFITNVTFSTEINNDTVAQGGTYTDFSADGTGFEAAVGPGTTYNLSVTINPEVDKISVFFDWNGNGTIERATEEVALKTNTSPPPNPTYPYTTTVTVPATAILDATGIIMRVVVAGVDLDTDPVPTDGAQGIPGEAEDYLVTVSNSGSNSPEITVLAGPNGSVSPSGPVVTLLYNTASQVFNITPNPGFYISDVVVDGVSQTGPPTSYEFTNIVSNHTISATFTDTPFHTITVTQGANGRIVPTYNAMSQGGLVRVNDGTIETFSILADPGNRVSDVTVGSIGSVGAVSSYTFGVGATSDDTITASFVADAGLPIISSTDYNYEWITNVTFGTINKSSNAEGYGSFLDSSTTVQQGGSYPISISIHPQADENISVFIDWNQNGIFTDAGEETVVATFAATAGPHVATVEVPGGAVVGTTRMRVVVRYFEPAVSSGDLATAQSGGEAEDYTINVAVPDDPPQIISSAGPNGAISPLGVTEVSPGVDSPPFTITPDPGYFISDIRIDGVALKDILGTSIPTPRDPYIYTFTNVVVTHTITATFSDIPVYTITATAGPHGAIAPMGMINLLEGADQTFTITPVFGYRIADVVVDSVSVGKVSSYTFTNVAADHAITAMFERIFNWAMFMPAIVHTGAQTARK